MQKNQTKKLIFPNRSVKDFELSLFLFRYFFNDRLRFLRKHGSCILTIALIFLLSSVRYCMPATIVLDPGHGGNDRGANNGTDYDESQFTLALAQETARLLAPDHIVEMTRNSGVTLPIADRAGKANHFKADLMISLHAGVAPYCGEGKAVVFFHEDQRLVLPTGISGHNEASESEANQQAWVKLQVRHQHQSQYLATLIRQSLLDEGTFDQITVRGAPLAVLMGTDLPAVLIEVGCLHPSTAISASKIDQRINKYAQSIANAVNIVVTKLLPSQE